MRKLAIALVALFACGELPDPQRPEKPLDPQDGGNLPVDDTPPEAPLLEWMPTRYGYASLPLSGYAEAGSTVFVEGGKAPVATDAGVGGEFCVDVPLRESVTQTLMVYAQDARGLTSSAANLTVTHDPTLEHQTNAAEPPLFDVAAGKAVLADEEPKEGTLAAFTDGNDGTSVLLPETMVWIDLGATYRLETVSLVFPAALGNGDDTFATEYMVLASSSASPTVPPDLSSYDWDVLFDVYPGSPEPAGDGGTDVLELPAPHEARFVAIHLIENNKTDWFSSENLRVAEVHVEGRAAVEAPGGETTVVPTCANGAPLD